MITFVEVYYCKVVIDLCYTLKKRKQKSVRKKTKIYDSIIEGSLKVGWTKLVVHGDIAIEVTRLRIHVMVMVVMVVVMRRRRRCCCGRVRRSGGRGRGVGIGMVMLAVTVVVDREESAS